MAILEFGGHAQWSEGVTIGVEHNKDDDNYLDSSNVEQFAKDLQNIRLASCPSETLIVLMSCNLGNFTKQDEGGQSSSLVQKLSDKTGMPVLSPGGFCRGRWAQHAFTGRHVPEILQKSGNETFYEHFSGRRRKEIETMAHDSIKDRWYYTTPNRKAD